MYISPDPDKNLKGVLSFKRKLQIGDLDLRK